MNWCYYRPARRQPATPCRCRPRRAAATSGGWHLSYDLLPDVHAQGADERRRRRDLPARMMGSILRAVTQRVNETSPFLRLSNTAASIHPPVRRVPQRGVRRGVGREVVQMQAGEHDEYALEERKFEAKASVSALERRIGSRPLDGDERGASLVKIAIEIGVAEAAEVRPLPQVPVGGDLRGVLEWVDTVGVGTDAPGPQ